MNVGHRHPRACATEGRRARRRLPVWAAIAATAAACGGAGAPPPPGSLPVAPGATVIASAAGGSAVDPAHDHNRYRYMAIRGPAHVSGARLMTTEVQWLTSRGWGQERSVAYRAGSTAPQPVPITTVGAEVLLNSPGQRMYAAMSLVPNAAVAGAQSAHTPLFGNAAIGAAVTRHRPVLWIVLGHGPHS